MTNIEVSPSLALRQYVWAVLKANDPVTWNTSKYGGLTPIVPLNEEPELDEFSGPRIVYEYNHPDAGVSYYRQFGNMTLAIRDDNFRRLGKTMNILENTFNRMDESARDVNDYIDRKRVAGVDLGISFGSINVAFAQSGTPETQEGGRMVGIVDIEFDFFAEYIINTRPPV